MSDLIGIAMGWIFPTVVVGIVVWKVRNSRSEG